MNKSILYLFATILLSSISFAQEKTIKGRIIIDIVDSPADGIKITNLRTNLSSITDLTGSFALSATIKDTLQIHSALYEPRNFVLKESTFNKPNIDIHLNAQPVILPEAYIMPKLTGILEKDAKFSSKKDPVTELYKELGVNPDIKIKRDTTKFTLGKDISPLHLNVEKLLEVFNGGLRKRQNLFEYEGKEEKIQQIREYFGDEYFTNDLGIPREKIREFIFFAYETSIIPTYLEADNYFSIMTELIKRKEIYLNRLNSKSQNNE